MGRGIDYSGPLGTCNRDPETGIRYGVIPLGALGEFAHESFEPEYAHNCPHCGEDIDTDEEWETDACPTCGKESDEDDRWGDEPIGYSLRGAGYEGFQDSAGDAWFTLSPYYTRAAFCSPCAPGACYLTSPCDEGERAYCPGPDWFDKDDPAPFQIYSVATGRRVPAVGDKLTATEPGECFETGRVYTVIAVYDGKMDLECAALDTTVSGVQIDDPSLQPYKG
jgi:hypothetical protein